MEIGAKVYYEKSTGNVAHFIGERFGKVSETTKEQDFASYVALANRVPDSIGMIQLTYGSHYGDYEAGGIVTQVDLETKEPLFTYPKSVDPETPEPRPALSEQVGSLGGQMAEIKLQDIENQTVINSLGGELAVVRMQSIQQQQTITSLGAELAIAKLEIIQLKGGEP